MPSRKQSRTSAIRKRASLNGFCRLSTMTREDRNNELTAQVTAQQEDIARLTQANAELKSELKSRTAQRVQPERIPDDRVQGLQEQVSTLEDRFIKDVSALARACQC